MNYPSKPVIEDKNAPILFDKDTILKSFSFFFSAVDKDYRISSTHLGIFSALLRYSILQGFANPIRAFSYQIMPLAKISASRTYHKHIRELSQYGYIKYEPSFKNNKPSCIYFITH